MGPQENQCRIYEIRRSDVAREVEAFLIDRRARGLSEETLRFYQEKLGLLLDYLASQEISDVESLSPRILRAYILELSNSHNPGGVHAAYRAMRAFLNWWEDEVEPDDWKNPLRKVHPPKVPTEPLDPAPLPDIRAMLSVCPRRTMTGDRDRAILLCLLDSGCRRSEFLALNVGDVNMTTGAVLVRSGKGGKPRTTFFGAKSRRALSAYLRHRPQVTDTEPVWVTRTYTRLTPNGLREVLRRRAGKAGVEVPSIHSFRRAFALACLRSGTDLVSLQRLLGHSNLTVLRRYLAQTEEDLRRAHEVGGPVDNML